MKRPSWLAVSLAGAGGFLAGVLLVAILGGPKGVTHTTTKTTTVRSTATVTKTDTVTKTVDARAAVPDVVGQSLPDASDALDAAGFGVDTTGGFVLNPDNWVVVDQDPAAGAPAEAGSTVTLSIDRG